MIFFHSYRVMRSKLNAYDAKFAYKWNVLMNRTTNNHQFKLVSIIIIIVGGISNFLGKN